RELELQRLASLDLREVEHRPGQGAQMRAAGAGEEIEPARDRDVVDAVARRVLELRRRNGIVRAVRLVDVETCDAGRLPPQLLFRASQRVRLEELERHDRGDEAAHDDPGEEERREPE